MACIPAERLLKKLEEEGFTIKSHFVYPNLSAVLSTVSQDGIPSSRTLYIKQIIDFELYFFTNQHSQKIQEISKNPFISLCMFFEKSFSQIIIQGEVKKAPREMAVNYFNSRDGLSKAGAILSKQSTELKDYDDFVLKAHQLKKQNLELECPTFWNCYKIIPNKIEFWKGEINRLHLREAFTKKNLTWNTKILYP
jgi:pyridoxamine 5'-phosphate oxidase